MHAARRPVQASSASSQSSSGRCHASTKSTVSRAPIALSVASQSEVEISGSIDIGARRIAAAWCGNRAIRLSRLTARTR